MDAKPGMQGSIDLINQQWTEAMQYLVENNVPYGRTTQLCKELMFFDRFIHFADYYAESDLMNCTANQLGRLYRAVIEPDEKKVNGDRFIPKWEFASLNRMNDKDKLYHYFSTERNGGKRAEIIKTGIAEIRAEEQDKIWRCEFNLKGEYEHKKILCLDSMTKDIPKNDEEFISRVVNLYKKGEKDKKAIVEREAANIYLRLLELSKVFAPIDKNKDPEEQRKQYKPFHFISDHFEKNGYIGIRYRSTVSKEGLVLVLFDKEYTEPVEGSIKRVDFHSGKVII